MLAYYVCALFLVIVSLLQYSDLKTVEVIKFLYLNIIPFFWLKGKRTKTLVASSHKFAEFSFCRYFKRTKHWIRVNGRKYMIGLERKIVLN